MTAIPVNHQRHPIFEKAKQMKKITLIQRSASNYRIFARIITNIQKKHIKNAFQEPL
jgi:hypothetical protein